MRKHLSIKLLREYSLLFSSIMQYLMQSRTNFPHIAMSFSDIPFPYGPFVPHHVPKQYIESYFSTHKIDSLDIVSFNTTVEDVSLIPGSEKGKERWNLTLRKYDPVLQVDKWWEEDFDAVILANGHYSVPFVTRPLYFPLP